MVYINRKAVRGWGETTAGYRQVITEGIESIYDTIRARMEKLDPTVPGDIEKEDYLKALLISAEGICTLADRYGDEANRPPRQRRYKEKDRTSEYCRGRASCSTSSGEDISRGAAVSLYLSDLHFYGAKCKSSYNPGRMDQYLYPVYKADLKMEGLQRRKRRSWIVCGLSFPSHVSFRMQLQRNLQRDIPCFKMSVSAA